MKAGFIDTIAAQATPFGRGGVGVVRLSGPKAKDIGLALTKLKTLKPRFAHYATFWHEEQRVDQGLCLFFSGPHSFTGEDVVELHGHGGPVVMDALTQACLSLGARLARPGEFSERAFLNDKIDLTQAEAIADLIDASSKEAARAAVRGLTGEFSKNIHALNKEMIELRVYVEAAIDFPDEEIDFLSEASLEGRFKKIQHQFESIYRSVSQGLLLKEGKQIAIIGEPNVGKSTLMNRWTGAETAIVTDIPGTTRDLIHQDVLLEGIPIRLVDTAGIRITEDIVERKGIERAKEAMAQADLIVLMIDARTKKTAEPVEASLKELNKPLVTLFNKIDLTDQLPGIESDKVYLCAKEGHGFEAFLSFLKMKLGLEVGEQGAFVARRRHLEALNQTQAHLSTAYTHLCQQSGELMAEELRMGSNCLSQITGEFTADDLLGEIFSSFCIGK